MAEFDPCVCGLSRVKYRRGESRVRPRYSSEAARLGQDVPPGILKRMDQRDPSFVLVRAAVIVGNASGGISAVTSTKLRFDSETSQTSGLETKSTRDGTGIHGKPWESDCGPNVL